MSMGSTHLALRFLSSFIKGNEGSIKDQPQAGTESFPTIIAWSWGVAPQRS